jgi:hypothetical protein
MKTLKIRSQASFRVCKYIHCIWVTICFIIKGLIGTIIIILAVIITGISYLLCMPFVLIGSLKKHFSQLND